MCARTASATMTMLCNSHSCVLVVASIIGWAVIVIGLANIAGASTERTHNEQTLDRVICGPRCVKYLLDYYGRGSDCDLTTLIQELQWPHFERGASLSDVAQALSSRGVYTLAIDSNHAAYITWEFPAIIHLNGESLGHFVVLLPSRDDNWVQIWSGLEGLQTVATHAIQGKATGAILLTSTSPIGNDVVERMSIWLLPPSSDYLIFAANVLLAVIATIIFIAHRKTKLRRAMPSM